MNKPLKKTVVILLSLIFLSSAISIVSAENVSEQSISVSEEKDKKVRQKEITLLRFGPKGEISPQKVMLTLDSDQDVGVAIANLCNTLFENDIEMQASLTDNNTTASFLSKIWSVGRGFHFKTKLRIQLSKPVDLFPLLPPYFKTAIFIPVNFCKYSNDPKAKTVIKPLMLGQNKTYEGPHSVLNIGFVGYQGWLGHISFAGFIMRTGYAGVTAFVVAKEL